MLVTRSGSLSFTLGNISGARLLAIGYVCTEALSADISLLMFVLPSCDKRLSYALHCVRPFFDNIPTFHWLFSSFVFLFSKPVKRKDKS